MKENTKSFGTSPVFFTAISTILGAILFLRFGWAVGTLGFPGTILIVLLGHLVTIPTALAISEIATNQRVEGGGEYFIISRSFGLNIGATIGIALYLSQAISVAFYIIAFSEAFRSVFPPDFMAYETSDGNLVSIPLIIVRVITIILLAYLMLRKGSSVGMKTLYFVVAILVISLVLFFMGKSDFVPETSVLTSFRSGDISANFFVVFAVIFPAFTGMTAGVGLSGDLKNPGKSIPLGTTLATVAGMIIYGFIAWKLAVSASAEDLQNIEEKQLIMSDIALWGPIIIPIGLAASTLSSALGSIMVAPRTLQALGNDKSIPMKGLNPVMARGKGKSNEPYNATILTSLIAFVFLLVGDVNKVAGIISMFFMVTYGSICLISFLYHFGADPSYRPVFRSRWWVSMIGFLACIWLMFRIDGTMAIVAVVVMVLLYLIVSYLHKDRGGMQSIFQAAIFQLSRRIQVFIQKSKKGPGDEKWRPSVVCVSKNSFERDKALKLLNWIAYKYGFGTYIHLIEDYFSKASNQKAQDILEHLIDVTGDDNSVYLDTLISPSYTSAIAQIVQLPGISGMNNNMMLFEFNKENPGEAQQISENLSIAKAAGLDVCLLASTAQKANYKKGIHVWIRSSDFENSNLMILLSYIILGHPDWRKGKIKIFEIASSENIEASRQKLVEIIQVGRLPISPANIEVIEMEKEMNIKSLICERSKDAGLTMLGFRVDTLKHNLSTLEGYAELGDVLFVNAANQKEIE